MISTKEKQKLRKFINELSLIRGRHTELVSVYIPAGYELIKIIQHLEQEQGTASNIKDAKTRKNVVDSLEKLIRHLRLFKKTPPNGLAAFAGNTIAQENKTNIQVWSIEPPEPLKTRIYRCDQTFLVDLLKDMMESKEKYALIVMDRREATLGMLQGTSIKVLVHLTSGVPGKIKAGGQSSRRYARITEGLAKEFYKRVAEAAKKEFFDKKDIKGLLIGGPGPTKEEFKELLVTELRQKILAVQDLTYTDESGLHHLVDKSQDIFAKEAIAQEKAILNVFFETLAKDPEKVAYGEKEVERALNMGAVETLLVSENLPDDKIEHFEALADQTGAKEILISVDTKEGMQLKDLTGIAAILRYSISNL
jgi:peptide chain release factor subunit 1